MAEAQSTKWIIVTLLYFFLINTIVIGSQGVADYYGQDTNITYTNSTLTNVYTYGVENCSGPRYDYFLSSEGVLKSGREQGYLYTPFLSDNCEFSAGIYSENVCTRINGCEWINITSGFWFWETTTDIQTCEGEINFTYYNLGVEPSTFDNICELPLLDNNSESTRTTCEDVGCSIVSYDYSSNSYSARGIWRNLKDLATFSLDFNTDVPLLAIIISFFALYLPLILLIIQMRYILPL